MSFKAISRKFRNVAVFGVIALLAVFTAISCNIPPAGNTATLKINLAADMKAKTLQPGTSLDVVTYDI